MEPSQIREKIKNLRNTKGITQKEMAKALFMDARTYSNFERGIRKSIDVNLLVAISKILETDVTGFITNTAAKEEKGVPADVEFQQILKEISELKAFFLSEIKEIKRELQVEKAH